MTPGSSGAQGAATARAGEGASHLRLRIHFAKLRVVSLVFGYPSVCNLEGGGLGPPPAVQPPAGPCSQRLLQKSPLLPGAGGTKSSSPLTPESSGSSGAGTGATVPWSFAKAGSQGRHWAFLQSYNHPLRSGMESGGSWAEGTESKSMVSCEGLQ